MAKSMFETVRDYSIMIKDDRTIDDILNHTMEELGELTEEIQIKYGWIEDDAGPDGIVGESIDILACVLDMIHNVDIEIKEGVYNRMLGVCEYRSTTHELLMNITVDIGKLATEVKIAKGRSYKVSTDDGIVRKCVDIARHAWCIIYSDFISDGVDIEDIDHDILQCTMLQKCIKWKSKVSERANNKLK